MKINYSTSEIDSLLQNNKLKWDYFNDFTLFFCFPPLLTIFIFLILYSKQIRYVYNYTSNGDLCDFTKSYFKIEFVRKNSSKVCIWKRKKKHFLKLSIWDFRKNYKNPFAILFFHYIKPIVNDNNKQYRILRKGRCYFRTNWTFSTSSCFFIFSNFYL